MLKLKKLIKEYGSGFLNVFCLNIFESCCYSVVFLFISFSQKYLINSLLNNNSMNEFIRFFILSIIASITCIFVRKFRVKKTEELISHKRKIIYISLLNAEYNYYKDKKEIIAKFNQNFDYYQKFIIEDLPRAILVYCNIVIMSIGVFSIDPIFLYISIITAILFSSTLPLMKKLEKIENETSDSSEISWRLFENIKKNRDIFVFYKGSISYLVAMKKEFSNIECENKKKALLLAQLNTVGLATNLIREFGIIIVAMTLFGSEYGFGDIFSLFMLTSFLNTAIVEIINTYSSLQVSYIAMNKMSKFNNIAKEETGILNESDFNNDVNSIKLSDVSYDFEDKTIKFPNIELDRGYIHKIQGPVGKGKTTLIQIIAGIRKCSSGEIVFDQQELTLNQLRNLTCLVDQNNKIFTGSILENITMFSEEYDINRVYELIKITGLDSRFELNESGLNELISNKNGLSGGQMQRVNICRALYKDAPIYLLDEPFSSIDNDNIKLIAKHLEKISNKKILVIVDHKNSLFNIQLKVVDLT